MRRHSEQLQSVATVGVSGSVNCATVAGTFVHAATSAGVGFRAFRRADRKAAIGRQPSKITLPRADMTQRNRLAIAAAVRVDGDDDVLHCAPDQPAPDFAVSRSS